MRTILGKSTGILADNTTFEIKAQFTGNDREFLHSLGLEMDFEFAHQN